MLILYLPGTLNSGFVLTTSVDDLASVKSFGVASISNALKGGDLKLPPPLKGLSLPYTIGSSGELDTFFDQEGFTVVEDHKNSYSTVLSSIQDRFRLVLPDPIEFLLTADSSRAVTGVCWNIYTEGYLEDWFDYVDSLYLYDPDTSALQAGTGTIGRIPQQQSLVYEDP
jgi:hypothetical protein